MGKKQKETTKITIETARIKEHLPKWIIGAVPKTIEIEKDDLIVIIEEKIESETVWVNHCYTECEENPIAECVGSIGYGELLHEVEDFLNREKYHFDRFFREMFDSDADENNFKAYFIDLVKRAHKDRGARDELISLCDLTYVDNWGAVEGEICSMSIGEQEHPLDDDLCYLLSVLDDSDREEIERNHGIRGDWLYEPFHYCRWSMVLNEGRCIDKAVELRNNVVSIKAKGGKK